MCVLAKDPIPRAAGSIAIILDERSINLEPLAEVERALLVVEVLHAPHPELGGLLLVGGEHFTAEQRGRQPSVKHSHAPTTSPV